ncbi:chemotaxis protein CheW, partial [Cycloclasticus pugetii]|uniref:chemotaxis protein CheW n=1 Tax=Cycloclasticus pugetii TaxID=34068 RepID=UPI003A8CA22B
MSSKTNQSQKLLLFRLFGSRLFGIGTLKIREILPFRRLTKLPHSHHAVIGTATFRDSAVPVIDMSAAVGYPALTKEEQEKASIIVTDIQRQEFGFLVRG